MDVVSSTQKLEGSIVELKEAEERVPSQDSLLRKSDPSIQVMKTEPFLGEARLTVQFVNLVLVTVRVFGVEDVKGKERMVA